MLHDDENALKVEPQGKLNNPRQVELRTDHPEGSVGLVIRVVAAKSAGLAELNPIPHIESFGTKYQIDLFCNPNALENCSVPVGYSLCAQCGVGTALVSETVIGRRSETIGVEPAVLPGDGAS